MGNREDLIAGARRCLEEKGWARTTVRDISAAAGVSMAAIGYHFGSREALLNVALVEGMREWSDEVNAALQAMDAPDASPAQRYEAMWTQMIKSVNEHRTLWMASVEAMVQAEHSPELREQLVGGQREAREGMAMGMGHQVGSVQLALLFGVMSQWVNDPERAPSGADVLDGLRKIVGQFDG
ncbi:TetR/AcrR family transcriptional regulator [Nonomuraea sp. NPDC050536]|uniref:TetR/AcrR family transcriptional regulator n=1 Tax=Nonomuraea sp. NPDC050536 TaxID=3364366 RepID=UPI0037CB4160